MRSSLALRVLHFIGLAAAQTNTTQPSEPEIVAMLQGMADGFRSYPIAPLMHWPDEEGLEYENVYFPADDGVTIEGWFIPSNGSNKVIIANHPRWFNRAGLPGVEPWSALVKGNDWEVNFVPDYKLLHDAGYNVLAYDLRNHGQSGNGNNGLYTSGHYESRDVIGSINYIRNREDTKNMNIGLFSRCNGANSNLHAIRLKPQVFEGIKCMVAVQPLSAKSFMTRALEGRGVPLSYLDDLDKRVYLKTSFHIDQLTPIPSAKFVKMPTFMYQVYADFMTSPSDVQAIFDNIPIEDKTLYWINGTDKRWDGYTWFQENPDQVLNWLSQHMA
ncbi:unnamed protein product [Clonostachys solani]|uniref:Alpha/beta-hydrolase n=1 Tax=Clonostachys solani TaxID=160281 RepID=A0A9N9ZNU1_9HYPO|nr:unnamed protein product [Clonostachys solani]